MSIDWVTLLGVLLVLTVGGWGFVGILMWLMRWHVFRRPQKECWGRLDFWLGSVERLVATAMFVWHVSYLGAFIGAWVALKLAANWQRLKSTSDEVRKGTLMALIGNIFSFGFAIAVGYWLNPTAIAFFTK
jgi:hypothetical protein